MTNEIRHRGPDDQGFYTDKGISLGHRRLSIIDLSKKGHQPMFNEHRDLVVIFNGEIYNFKSVRLLLEKKGHKFTSNSDTEVLLHGYEEYGEKLPSLLEGMFAFVIWDKKNKILFGARDRFGKKPFYYSIGNDGLIFASEIKALLSHETVSRTIDKQCLSEYLALRYSSGNLTMFKDVKKLLPGNTITWKKSKLKIKPYFSLPTVNSYSKPDSEKLYSLVDAAVEERLMSDVPIGVFLSGGLDSSTLVAFASRHIKNLKTFSIGFNHKTDETSDARKIANHFGTDHTEIISDSDSLANLPKIVWHLDEPLADPANLPLFELSKHVSKKVKVALSGEGGDEVFGGYHPTNYFKKIERINAISPIIRKLLVGPAFKTGSKLFSYPKKQILDLGSEIVSSEDLIASYKKMFYLPFEKDERTTILTEKYKSGVNLNSAFDIYISKGGDLRSKTFNYYFKEWLPNDLLMKADKMGMANGLEIRTPYLDADLVNYSIGLPNDFKHERFLFRKMAEKLLPKYVLKKRKQGFTLPISDWFTNKKFKDRVMPHIQDLSNRKIFNESEIDALVANPRKLRTDHKLWTLLNFELWSKIYLDNTPYEKIKI
jgi:asparagine synthase (glutamine-hydrolysing)